MNETLLYMGSKHIEQYIAANPVYWHEKKLAERGGVGDQAGMPPTPMVYEFLHLLKIKQSLFTQAEYRDHCFQEWYEWPALWDALLKKGVEAKLYRNVYPSMVDSLYVYSLLVEARWFDKCVLDSTADAISKHDLLVFRGDLPPIALDLFAGSVSAINDRQYKKMHRRALSGIDCQAYEVPLPMGRPQKHPGNKRWYCLKDFEQVYIDYCKEYSLWDTPVVSCTCGCCGKGKNVRTSVSLFTGMPKVRV